MSARIELAGHLFGKLVVISDAPSTKAGRAMWLCECECGKSVLVSGKELRSGNTKSCGCLKGEKLTKANKERKGERRVAQRNADHPDYQRWKGMKTRCYNPNSHRYADWGGRGVRICKEWFHDFKSFAKYIDDNLGRCPQGWTIDRINNEKHYEPGNVRWASPALQYQNTRRFYQVGYPKIITEWAPHIQA